MSALLNLFFSIIFIPHIIFGLDKEWWRHAVIYEVYTPSFKDSNGDGYGDLKGITSKLDYLKDLGVDAIWLTPFYPSPMLDTGYDVSDYVGINPLFGTMADFEDLMKELDKRGMKFIMDFVINHSSDQHQWFKKSVKRVEPYTDYYVWRDPAGYNQSGHPIPPNNWIALFGAPGWTWNEKRRQFYYHVFLHQQPDLNLRNPRVKKEIEKIIKFWLGKGVAGIRLDAVNWLMEDQSFKDEEYYDPSRIGMRVRYHEIKHDKTFNIKDSYEYVKEMRSYVNKLNAKDNTFERILIAEAWGTDEELKAFYGNKTHPGVHFPFNFQFIVNINYMTPLGLDSIINRWLAITPNTTAFNWLIESHDRNRAFSTFTEEYVHILQTIITQLPGLTILYYGGEIGMTAGVVRPEQRKWGSEYSRSPMQWDATISGGFTTNNKAWLGLNPNYWRLNVRQQMESENSTYHFLKDLLKLKKTKIMKYGDLRKYILPDLVYVFTRSLGHHGIYITVLNLGTEQAAVHLASKIHNLPKVLKVCLTSRNSGLKKGVVVIENEQKDVFFMKPMSVAILC